MEIRIDWNIFLNRDGRANHDADINIIDYDKNSIQEFSVPNYIQIYYPRLSINSNLINVRQASEERLTTYSWDLSEIVQFYPHPLKSYNCKLSFIQENATIDFGGVSTFGLFYHTQGLRASILNVNVHLPYPGFMRYHYESILKCLLKYLPKKTEYGHYEAGIYEVKLHAGGEIENIHNVINGRQAIVIFNKPTRKSTFPLISFSFKNFVKDYIRGIAGVIIIELIVLIIFHKFILGI